MNGLLSLRKGRGPVEQGKARSKSNASNMAVFP